MNISPISTNYNTNFQARLKNTKYVRDMLDFAIDNPRSSRRIVDGVKNILENGKNEIVELNYTGNKILDFIFPGAYKITKTINSEAGSRVEKSLWNYGFIGGGIGTQSELALAEINNGVIENKNLILDGLRTRVFKKQYEIFDEYDIGTGNPKIISKLHKQKDYLEKKYCALIREEAIKLKKIITQENNK